MLCVLLLFVRIARGYLADQAVQYLRQFDSFSQLIHCHGAIFLNNVSR